MGRPPSLSPEEVCQILALHPEPVVTAKDVHGKMDMTQRGAQERLSKLAEEGFLKKKKVGSSATVFWLTDRGRETLGDA